jgi:hypothetical protein
MSFTATTRIKIAEGNALDEYGDPGEANLPAEGAKDYRASIIEKSITDIDPTTGEARVVRYAVGRVDPGTPITEGSRLHDQRTGKVYEVQTLTINPRTIAGFSDVRLALRITDG